MTKRTCWYAFVSTLVIAGLAACGGSGGGGGGGGGSGVPTATNSAITPPPTAAVSFTTSGGVTSTTNQGIGANGLHASEAALSNATNASGLVSSVQADESAMQDTLGAIVRRHAEKLKDHKSSPTSTLQVATQNCSTSGTATFAFDDANLSAIEVFVNCNQGGTITHGTLSSSNVGVTQNLGSTIGSPYSITVTATFSIDLSITTGLKSVVNQGSFTFTAGFSGNMQAAANGGVEPGVPNRVQVSMIGTSLLASSGTVRARLSNFSLSVDDNDTLGRTTITGGYTYASTLIGGAITVSVSQPIMYQPQGAARPSSGAVTITSSGSPGKIVVTVISSPVVGVRVDVFANAADLAATDTVNLTWAQVDAL